MLNFILEVGFTLSAGMYQCLVFMGYVIKMYNSHTNVHKMYTGFFTTLYLRNCHNANRKTIEQFYNNRTIDWACGIHEYAVNGSPLPRCTGQ